MFSFIVSFTASALLTLLVIKQVTLYGPALDRDFQGVQKVHAHEVARIGGLSIFLATAISAAISAWRVPPMAPLVLGIILGDLLDLNLRRGLLLTNGDPSPFFTRPISAVICLIIVFTILMSIPAVSKRVRALFNRDGAQAKG